MSAIAEVLCTVNFSDGERAVFTVSPRGWLSPSQGDGVACSPASWRAAAAQLAGIGLGLPDPNASARSSGGETCWPWAPTD